MDGDPIDLALTMLKSEDPESRPGDATRQFATPYRKARSVKRSHLAVWSRVPARTIHAVLSPTNRAGWLPSTLAYTSSSRRVPVGELTRRDWRILVLVADTRQVRGAGTNRVPDLPDAA